MHIFSARVLDQREKIKSGMMAGNNYGGDRQIELLEKMTALLEKIDKSLSKK